VSEQIRQLERALGVTLFERVRAGIRLTNAGRAAFEHTSVMFLAGDRLVDALGLAPVSEAATLRVGVSIVVSRSVAPDFMFPLLELDGCFPAVQRGELADLLGALRGRELDLVFGETRPVGVARERLRAVEVCRPQLVAVGRDAIDPERSWEGVPLIQYGQRSVFRAEVVAFLERNQLRPSVIASSDDPLLMLESAIRGACVAFVPQGIARAAISAGSVRVHAMLDPGPITVLAIHRDAEHAPLVQRAVTSVIGRV
jgi:DNA-binding transcriptional LysR family regulator